MQCLAPNHHSKFTDCPAAMASVAAASTDLSITQKLNSLTADLLSSLRGDCKAANSFSSTLFSVDSLIHTFHSTLKAETHDVISAFKNVMAFLPKGIEQTECEAALLNANFANEVSSLLSSKSTTAKPSKASSSQPSYLQAVSRWLKDNWSNPYPTDEVRNTIARNTKSSRKEINGWFSDARRRIGWNDLRRKHFNNKQAAIVEAASLFAKSRVGDTPTLCAAVEQKLATIQLNAQRLHDDKFLTTALARQLDNTVRDMAPGLHSQLQEEKRRLQREASVATSSGYPYQSPSSSPVAVSERLPSPSPSSSRRSPVPEPNLTSPITPAPPSSLSVTNTRPPSPSSSTHDEYADISLPTSTRKRKRRLSDSLQQPPNKRSQTRPQAVSDPFPLFASMEEWEQWLCSSPVTPASSAPIPDTCIPLEIEVSSLFQHNTTFPNQLYQQTIVQNTNISVATGNLAASIPVATGHELESGFGFSSEPLVSSNNHPSPLDLTLSTTRTSDFDLCNAPLTHSFENQDFSNFLLDTGSGIAHEFNPLIQSSFILPDSHANLPWVPSTITYPVGPHKPLVPDHLQPSIPSHQHFSPAPSSPFPESETDRKKRQIDALMAAVNVLRAEIGEA
ncbi:C-terminal domain of homeodomain 1-domain-containing protein [Coprinopsis sp. MPI-PUGE-AT-0042]|nr:C-terminal domain of homeodomain 1-domain-containing protein [Coprinopsis sp. MPI-PUGE-AT-0042]